MNLPQQQTRRIAIACGGTGGHLFPGLAVADELLRRGCELTLLVSQKEIDQQALQGVTGMDIVTLPAIGLTRGRWLDFFRSARASFRMARLEFQQRRPQVALAMGGFTSAPPILAARQFGARTFLHESNTIPGRANRWLSWIVDGAFVGFASTARRLHTRVVTVTGTPLRMQRGTNDPGSCRAALGLEPGKPVILVMGGSQGAVAINELVLRTLPLAAASAPDWQWLHLAGSADSERVRRAYTAAGVKAVVQSFCTRMELALGAASAAISRAGASSLAEIAEMQIPAILVPYPSATDNHQHHNARAFAECGAAVLLAQADAAPEKLEGLLRQLLEDSETRQEMEQALKRLGKPHAARQIAEAVLAGVESLQSQPSRDVCCESRHAHGQDQQNHRSATSCLADLGRAG